MIFKVEVAKRKSRVDEEAIEEAIVALLRSRKVHGNFIFKIPSRKYEELNKFQDQLHSIAFNDLPVSTFTYKNPLIIFDN